MWKLALNQLRSHPRRYVALLIAIVLGTMFLAASLLVTSSAKETTKQMLGATYANADLLMVGEEGASFEPDSPFAQLAGTGDTPGTLEDLDGVQEVYPLLHAPAAMVLPDGTDKQGTYDADADFVYATNRPDDASLISTPIVDGALPEHNDELTLDAATADRYDLAVGDTVTIRTLADETEQDFDLSGIVDDSLDPTVVGAVTAYVTASTLTELAGETPGYGMALVRVDGNTDQVLADIQQRLDAAGVPVTVNTPEVQISEQLIDMLGFDAITVVLGGFSAIALLVMMLVIANTFSVLVAQRTRQYALQRVLGATRGQIRRNVLAESALIGLLGSLLGIGLAIGLMVGLMQLAQTWLPGAAFGMDPTILWVLVVGIVITVAASWFPAAQAMRVSPLEAMRPVPEVTAKTKAGTFRLMLGAVMLLAGGTALVYFSLEGLILAAIAAGAVAFIGVLALGVLFIPGAVYTLGWLPRSMGITGKMAQLNAVRNRSRTAATATALVVGTTLVAMILTGGRTAQDNTDELLATNYPVDIYAHVNDESLDLAALTEDIETTAGIAEAQTLHLVGTIDEAWASSDTVFSAEPAQLPQVSAGITDDDATALEQPGTVLVPATHESDTLTVTTPDGQEVTLDAVHSELSSITPVVSPQTAETLGSAPVGSPMVWIAVEDQNMAQADLQDLLNTLIAETELSAQDVSSPLIMRSIYQQVIDAVMLTVIGLLSISVFIAFVGVANTLALSTMERTRENSLMRALGLTKGGLRSMLTWEAILISAVGAILGSGLGMLFGWAGSTAIFSQISSEGPDMSWPWLEVGAVIVVAVLAGLIASLTPSRRAAKLAPVQGLATI